MHRNRSVTRLHGETPPIVPRSARDWLLPLGRLALAALILFGLTLTYALGRQAQHLADVAVRSH